MYIDAYAQDAVRHNVTLPAHESSDYDLELHQGCVRETTEIFLGEAEDVAEGVDQPYKKADTMRLQPNLVISSTVQGIVVVVRRTQLKRTEPPTDCCQS